MTDDAYAWASDDRHELYLVHTTGILVLVPVSRLVSSKEEIISKTAQKRWYVVGTDTNCVDID
jgi:hypothetical protein